MAIIMYDFENVSRYITDVLVGEKHVPGCEAVVFLDHKQLYSFRCGYSDYARGVQVDGSELYNMYSCTKPLTVTAGMRLVEEGRLKLDAPVVDYLPEFANIYLMRDGKRVKPEHTMTVRHLFTMTAGFDYNLDRPAVKELLAKGGAYSDTRHIIGALTADPIRFEPGDHFQYSLCHDVLAAVVETVAGERFSDYLSRIIFTPLGMGDSVFHPSEAQTARLAAQYSSDREGKITPVDVKNCMFVSENYESGGAGLISSVADYIKFADVMACGGTSEDGYRLLKPETIALLRTNQLDERASRTFGCAAGPGYGYGLGVRTRISTENTRTPIGEFGWDGAAGAYVMMDCANRLSIFFAMNVLSWPSLIGCGHAPIREYVYEALDIG